MTVLTKLLKTQWQSNDNGQEAAEVDTQSFLISALSIGCTLENRSDLESFDEEAVAICCNIKRFSRQTHNPEIHGI